MTDRPACLDTSACATCGHAPCHACTRAQTTATQRSLTLDAAIAMAMSLCSAGLFTALILWLG